MQKMAVLSWTFIVAAFFCLNSFTRANSCTGLKCFLPVDYDRRTRPNEDTGKPLAIELGLFVESFGEVDVQKMEFQVFGYLSQQWTDDRLAKVNKTPLILEGKDAGLIWLPDIYCINCRESNLDNGRNDKQGMVRIDNGGEVYFSFLFVGVASCKMDLHKFPFDTQTCSLEFSSYAYNLSRLTYRWSTIPFVKLKSMDQFLMKNEKASTRIDKYMLGNFTISQASFTFERRVGFYILQLYIPTAMLVCLSWTMFCLNRVHSGERITIGVTLFLTMIFLNGYANTSLPKVSYIKSVDSFMVFSLAEILFIIIESIIVTKLLVKKDAKLLRKCSQMRKRNNTMDGIQEGNNKENNEMELKCCLEDKEEADRRVDGYEKNNPNWVSSIVKQIERKRSILSKSMEHQIEEEITSQKHARKKSGINCKAQIFIEKVSVVLFPASYMIFNAWYWLSFIHEH